MTISTDIIFESKYPAKKHAERVVKYIASKGGEVSDAVLYLESAKTRMNEDNDQEAPFRQRRYFYYLTGCDLPDSYLTYDTKNNKTTLFIPPVVAEEVVWSGMPLSPEEALEQYDVDDCKTSDQVTEYLSHGDVAKKQLWAIENQTSNEVQSLPFESKDLALLKEAIEETRVVKDDYEIALMRKANEVSEIAHKAVMQAVSKASNEQELEALFLQQCITNGCRKQAYSSILASGTDASTLHYVKNNKALSSKTRNILVDAGGEYNNYASDITRTFPVNGEFTRGSESIYNIVLKMQKECIAMLKAGVLWDDVHEHAHRVAIEGLLEIGILKGDPKEILEARTSTAFFPHGLGHYLGMDTHDSGGHPNYNDSDPMFKYLRVRGNLPAGSVITVEPGIYFCKFIIDPALKNEKHAQYINKDVLDGYWEVGGVRIEDNILITEDGYENLTTVPKEIDEMTKLITS